MTSATTPTLARFPDADLSTFPEHLRGRGGVAKWDPFNGVWLEVQEPWCESCQGFGVLVSLVDGLVLNRRVERRTPCTSCDGRDVRAGWLEPVEPQFERTRTRRWWARVRRRGRRAWLWFCRIEFGADGKMGLYSTVHTWAVERKLGGLRRARRAAHRRLEAGRAPRLDTDRNAWLER